jgi:dTDP-4-dehydrorhamnose 3,5-epimerase
MQSSIQPLIDGLGIHALVQKSDARGTVLHMIRNDSQDFHGFGECYFSEILPSAVKAWKFHFLRTENVRRTPIRCMVRIDWPIEGVFQVPLYGTKHALLEMLQSGKPGTPCPVPYLTK